MFVLQILLWTSLTTLLVLLINWYFFIFTEQPSFTLERDNEKEKRQQK